MSILIVKSCLKVANKFKLCNFNFFSVQFPHLK